MKKFFSLLAIAAIFAACSDDDGVPTPAPVPDKYQGGFYVLNEGSYGRTSASVNYYDIASGQWSLNIFQANNPDEKLGNTGTVAVCSTDNMYIVSKETPRLVEVGLADFVKKSALPEDALSGQAYGFALIDDGHGVLTTSDGAYSVSLNPIQLEQAFYEGRSLWGDVAVKDGYIFMTTSANEDYVVKVYKASTLEFVKDFSAVTTGFAEAGGMLWAANKDKLVKIDPTTLTANEFALPDGISVYYNQWAYTPSGLHASKKGDALYFVEGTSYGYDVYKFTIASGTASKLFSAPVVDDQKYSVYASGLNVDPKTDDLYLFYTNDWGSHVMISVVDGASGDLKKTFPYTDAEYWFPSMAVFR